MAFTIGVVLFALGILVSIALHEYGHYGTARAFGMKVTRFFIGFGPTLFSFRRGDTEYGLKGIPAGAFVKIVGMTPQDDDVDPADQHRVMWKYPVWKRTVVLAAGSGVHFILGFAILWALFAFAPINDYDQLESAPPMVSEVSDCVPLAWDSPSASAEPPCDPDTAVPSPAREIGLAPGDTITAMNGRPVDEWGDLTDQIRAAGGETVTLTFERDGQRRTAEVALPLAERVRQGVEVTSVEDVTPADVEEVGVLGITPVVPQVQLGPVAAVGEAADRTVLMFQGTIEALGQLPERVPELWSAVFGGERSPETPISVVGASRIGGDLWAQGEIPTFLALLAALNFFIGIFNLVPLLPLDGGHIAIAWFEKARSWVYARLGRPDPGRVDYYKLMPVTYAVIIIMAGFFLLTIAADIVNPIRM